MRLENTGEQEGKRKLGGGAPDNTGILSEMTQEQAEEADANTRRLLELLEKMTQGKRSSPAKPAPKPVA